ncbi:caspase family protein [Nocardioides sp. WS12]|uniref:caspase family protein n=1 Tax=Nocardioides sp. WS12 TaxID=2486272 RepID=UPI0015FAFAE6|nr:caspase family protein [Nocardioides sp. WS12]
MRKALIVGIDYYENLRSLNGAVNDAYSVKATLERNADGTRNFAQPNLMTSTGGGSDVTRAELREAIEQLFKDDAEIALLYFSGHGHIDGIGGYLCASDFATEHDGLSFADVMSYANQSPAKNKVIILDSCHSGAAGSNPISGKVAEISEGITILTASAANQYSIETGGSGVFTSLLIDALSGAAANLIGDVTPGSVYAHVDQSLGPWSQRPIFKTNVKEFVSLRKADAPIELGKLHKLVDLFEDPTTELILDPGYEPERSGSEEVSIPKPDPIKTMDFAVLQALRSVNLVRPVGAPHMWHAAMESKACELTVLGQHYWSLVKRDLI